MKELEKWLLDWINSQNYKFCYSIDGGYKVFTNQTYTIVVHSKRGLCLMYPYNYWDRFENWAIMKDLKTQSYDDENFLLPEVL